MHLETELGSAIGDRREPLGMMRERSMDAACLHSAAARCGRGQAVREPEGGGGSTRLSALLAMVMWPVVMVLAGWAGLAGASTDTEPRSLVAVVYAEADEPMAGVFAHIIQGIEGAPDVQVFRIPLQPGELAIAAAERGIPPIRLAFNGDGGVAVLYPDIGEPYRSVFSQIIDGIEDKANRRVVSYAVGANLNAQELASELQRKDIRVVIALGRHGVQAASSLDRGINVVAGGVFAAPDAEARGMSVFSLAPDPALLFARLKALQPSTKRVFVVYDPRQNDWLIKLAREAARGQGLELVAREAQDLKNAALLYQDVLADVEPGSDALWLPQDSTTVEDSAILPMVLQQAWNRSLTVFSSSIAHVKRGALFSLYPNNVELGRSLADSATGHPPRGVVPLREVLLAVNVRTAGHLGIKVNPKQQRFDLVFPEQ